MIGFNSSKFPDPMDDWLTPDDEWWGRSYIGQTRTFLVNPPPPLYATFVDDETGDEETINMETMKVVYIKKNITSLEHDMLDMPE